jgi:LacI family transcriptional regulator
MVDCEVTMAQKTVDNSPAPAAGNPHQSVTLTDVAKAAGVSVATVSRVLNGGNKEKYKSSAAKGEHIRGVARKLGYRPDWRAKTLRSGKSNTIGIVYSQTRPLIDMTASEKLFRSLGDAVQSAGYNLVFVHVPPDEGQGSLPASILQTTDAAVFYHSIGEGEITAAALLRGPAVQLNCENKLPYPQIVPDDVGGSKMLAWHLLSFEHRRVCYLDIEWVNKEFDHFSQAIRRDTVTQTIRDVGGTVDVWKASDHCDYAALVDRLLAIPESKRPTALVCTYSVHAICVLNELIRRGVKVPEDISIATFDDYQLVAEAIVPLTTIAVPMEDLGRAGANSLLDTLSGKTQKPTDNILISERLIARQSTGPAKA